MGFKKLTPANVNDRFAAFKSYLKPIFRAQIQPRFHLQQFSTYQTWRKLKLIYFIKDDSNYYAKIT